jgi:prophage regulatory protein
LERIIKLFDVQELTKHSRSTIYRLMGEGVFPKQVKLSMRSVGWVESEVLGYLNNCIKNRKGKL